MDFFLAREVSFRLQKSIKNVLKHLKIVPAALAAAVKDQAFF